MKLQTSIVVLLTLVLGACTTLATAPPPTQLPSATILFTETVVLPSDTLTSTITPKPSETITDTPYASESYSDSLFDQKIGSLIITPNDIPPLDPNYPQLIDPKVQDLTSEIQNCDKDCVKVVWENGKAEGVDIRQVSIMLIRTDTDLQAAESVTADWNEFSQVENETGVSFTEGTLIHSDKLPDNSKVGMRSKEPYEEPNIEYMFIASRGPIFMKFVYYFQVSGDYVFDLGSIQHLASLQIEKLVAAGYPK